jgi:hypothetical protein
MQKQRENLNLDSSIKRGFLSNKDKEIPSGNRSKYLNNSSRKKVSRKYFKYDRLLQKKKRLISTFGSYLRRSHDFKKFLLLEERIKSFNKIKHIITIKVVSNNIFVQLSKIFTSKKKKKVIVKTQVSLNSGNYKIKTTRKKLKFNIKLVLSSFFRFLQKKFDLKHLIINITSPIKIRKEIVKFLRNNFKGRSILLNISAKKCFNGCRVPKRRRKKSRGLRILKQ